MCRLVVVSPFFFSCSFPAPLIYIEAASPLQSSSSSSSKAADFAFIFPSFFFLFPSFLMDSNFAPYFFLSHFTFYSLLFLKLLLLLIMDKDRVAEDT